MAATSKPAAPKREGPPFQPLMGDEKAERFEEQLGSGHWEELHEFLEATREWDVRNFYVTVLSDREGRPAWLEEWAAAYPDSAVTHLFLGAHGNKWAWEARGDGRATTVEQDAWAIFHQRLIIAQRHLDRSAELDPEDPNPHSFAIWSAMGLSLGQGEIRRRFDEAILRDRWHQDAHQSMVQALAAKWFGSNEEMFEFARAASDEAPPGSNVHTVIPWAHLEQWLNLSRESDDGRKRQLKYFLDDGVRREISAAADRCIRSPDYRRTRTTPADRNVFAMCFWLSRDYEAQLEQMGAIDPLIQRLPWAYQGNPGWAYERARTRAQEEIRKAAGGPETGAS